MMRKLEMLIDKWDMQIETIEGALKGLERTKAEILEIIPRDEEIPFTKARE